MSSLSSPGHHQQDHNIPEPSLFPTRSYRIYQNLRKSSDASVTFWGKTNPSSSKANWTAVLRSFAEDYCYCSSSVHQGIYENSSCPRISMLPPMPRTSASCLCFFWEALKTNHSQEVLREDPSPHIKHPQKPMGFVVENIHGREALCQTTI